ncbi:zona pellucida sperm-binding protein 3 isoform X2 [Etheostoma spectabile]|uniref:zona pellucida sperm-binding protein 3 isoform X2 n=1 Tax=Etheostoma spectabile TaxID=54343 RepID=UPI0013AFE0E9|nr:zona pellucida sperm-binding protein 3-like isoform X2 [Etheostoma spectabile]
MDSKLPRTNSRWILVLLMISTLPHFLYSTPSSHFSTRGRTHGNMKPQLTAVQPEPGTGLSLRPQSVVVSCYPGWMQVVVQADMFDTGLQVEGTHLRLGSGSLSEGSACGAVPSGEAEFTIQAHLSDCGTKLSSTREKIIYSNVLVYSPEPSSGGLLRLAGATIPVACHYEKRNAVNGISLLPIWVPSVSRISAEDHIDFNLLIMTEDWQFEKGSYSYFLGDPIHFQVSAVIGNHIPLRVYVDHCVATATPDAETTKRYDFIENHGCLADTYLTNSNSRFLPRIEEHKLRFQLEAFRFYQENSNQVYITCYVKAVPAELTVSSQNRACSLINNRWWSVDGNDQACRSCDVSHQVAQPLPTARPKTTIRTKAWPSKTSQQSSVQSRPEQHPDNYYRFPPSTHQSQRSKPQQSSAGVTKRGSEYNADRTVQLGPITVLPPHKTDKTIRF